jgi:hypothetical protein
MATNHGFGPITPAMVESMLSSRPCALSESVDPEAGNTLVPDGFTCERCKKHSHSAILIGPQTFCIDCDQEELARPEYHEPF